MHAEECGVAEEGNEGGGDDDLGIAGPSAFKRPSINDFRNDGEGKELSKSKQY